jgi:hypothetical protein
VTGTFRTCGLAQGLLAALAACIVSSAAAAAPLTVTYEITGGESFGGFLGNFPIQSGRLVISMPNRFSGPPPLHTDDARFDIDLTAINGAMAHRFFCCNRTRSASYGPAQADHFSYSGLTDCDLETCGWRLSLRASIGGKITRGGLSYIKRGEGYMTYLGVRGLTGQEVRVPEPASRSLLFAALVGAAAVSACGGIARRRRSSATPR